jgi:hypothetical protein
LPISPSVTMQMHQLTCFHPVTNVRGLDILEIKWNCNTYSSRKTERNQLTCFRPVNVP